MHAPSIFCRWVNNNNMLWLHLQLYEALHVEEHQIKKEQELSTRLEQLTDQLMPFEKVWLLITYFDL